MSSSFEERGADCWFADALEAFLGSGGGTHPVGAEEVEGAGVTFEVEDRRLASDESLSPTIGTTGSSGRTGSCEDWVGGAEDGGRRRSLERLTPSGVWLALKEAPALFRVGAP